MKFYHTHHFFVVFSVLLAMTQNLLNLFANAIIINAWDVLLQITEHADNMKFNTYKYVFNQEVWIQSYYKSNKLPLL